MARVKSEATEASPPLTSSAPFIPDYGSAAPKVAAPRVDAVGPFMLYHPAGAWTIADGRVVPRLSKFKIRPGVNGIEQDARTGKVLVGSALDELKRNGGTVIPYEVDGAGTSYVLKHRTHPELHHLKWELFQPGSASINTDAKGYADWLESLVTRNVIQAPRADELAPMRDGLVREIEELQADGKQHARIKALEKHLAAVETKLATLEAE
jgi:hypothetical protein